MRVGLAGFSGFVGSYIYEMYPDAAVFNSKNLGDVRGQSFDLFFCACVPAVKWHANAHPKEDRAVIETIQSHLDGIQHCGKFVLVSTIDAEACPDEPYGKNRLFMEEWCRERFDDACMIVRLPALFGLGLKKNILYDLLNSRLLDKIDPRSTFQWYDLRWLRTDLEYLVSMDEMIGTVSLYSKPVETTRILEELFPELADRVGGSGPGRGSVRYSCPSDVRFARSEDDVLASMKDFVEVYRATRDHAFCQRLAVSNLCWGAPRYDDHAASVLKKFNLAKVELAPSMYADWDALDVEAISGIVSSWKAKDIAPVSFQAILHGITSPQDASVIVRRLDKVAELAAAAGVRTLVLGSPSLRREPLDEDAWVDILRRVRVPESVRICVEPNSEKYGCRVGTTFRDVRRILATVQRSFAINFDAGNAYMESDDLNGLVVENEEIGHVQISAPYLGNLTKDLMSQYVRMGYCQVIEAAARRHISLEVRGDMRDLSDNIWTFVLFLRGAHT